MQKFKKMFVRTFIHKRIFGSLLLCLLITGCATDRTIKTMKQTVPQDARVYLANAPQRIKPIAQEKSSKNFLENYFLPWTKHFDTIDINKMSKLEIDLIEKYVKHPGYGGNKQPHTKNWIINIKQNANLKTFPNLNMKGITIHDMDVRQLPTVEPSFTNWTEAGEGYPFDNFQDSFLPANVPVRVLHISRDGNWYLIKLAGLQGWVKNDGVAFVTSSFMRNFQNRKFIVSNRDNVSVFGKNMDFRGQVRLGTLYPLVDVTRNYYKILFASPNKNYYATSHIVKLRKKYGRKFPIPLTTKNIVGIINTLIDKPYGWGGLYAYRDCSATTQDLFAMFGIWLPRNSTDQIHEGHFVSLENLNNKTKERKILNEAIPFLTLLHIPGHIAIYIGHHNGKPYLFHNTWGLHTKILFFKEGREIIGSSVITPIRFGEGYLNIPKSYLDRVDSMNLLVEKEELLILSSPPQKIKFG